MIRLVTILRELKTKQPKTHNNEFGYEQIMLKFTLYCEF